ncbi:MAG: F0F1 ATP synthase subunit epsilon [Alphaproteobacteria bacterium]|nr:F0F1 ATP synthase subunit epsilon [Alphaproteobacteria bacterium]
MTEDGNAAAFQFEMVSPEKILVSEKVTMVTIPGEAGDFGVLARHAPLLSSLRPGLVTVTPAEGEVMRFFVAGGFADVCDNHCAVLAEQATDIAEFDRAELEEKLRNLQDDLAFAKDDTMKTLQVNREIALAKARIEALDLAA